MRSVLISALLFFIFACSRNDHVQKGTERIPIANPASPVTAYVNGRWYTENNGRIKFEEGDRYSIAGVFTADKPAGIDTVIDLEGRYAVPPFGDAHNHNVEAAWSASIEKKYMHQGIFYYKNPNDIGPVTEKYRDHFNSPSSLDINFAHGGLTIDGGHPEPLYRSLAPRYGLDPDSLDGIAFYEIPSIPVLERRWLDILAGKPDFIKLYLVNAFNHGNGESHRLNPSVFKRAVKLAHEAGMRTTVHIESAADLRLAVYAGADEVAHLPGRSWRYGLKREDYTISRSLANEMTRRGTILVTTTIVTEVKFGNSPETKKAIQRLQKENLKRLQGAGVPIAIGTDSYSNTALDEVMHLDSMAVFDDAGLFRYWVQTGPASIFPDRAVGKLEKGYEASFLALDCNPVRNIECVTSIKMRIKQGIPVPD